MTTYQANMERPPDHMLDCFVMGDSNWLSSDAADRQLGVGCRSFSTWLTLPPEFHPLTPINCKQLGGKNGDDWSSPMQLHSQSARGTLIALEAPVATFRWRLVCGPTR
ncbi:hypothetical protein SAMN05444506_105255 [Pseudomonas syringae]|nr:hypothetical protein SAMN05444506_105255 [Pseudomonas syringae]